MGEPALTWHLLWISPYSNPRNTELNRRHPWLWGSFMANENEEAMLQIRFILYLSNSSIVFSGGWVFWESRSLGSCPKVAISYQHWCPDSGWLSFPGSMSYLSSVHFLLWSCLILPQVNSFWYIDLLSWNLHCSPMWPHSLFLIT
jgi:hypothetical protein